MMTREFRQDRLFLATLISFVPANGLLILLALGGDGAMAFAWSRVVGQVCVGLVIISTPQRFFWPRIDKARLAPVLKFGLPLAGANLVNYTLLNADFAFIGRLLGPAVLGTYVLAFNVASWSSSVLGSTINGVGMTAFSESGADSALLRERLARWARLTALVACPLATMTTVLSTDIVIGLYGDQWSEAGPVLAVLAIYGGVFTASLLLSNLLVAKGQSWRVLLIQIIWLAALVPAIWFGVSAFGVLGAAWAHVVIVSFIVMPIYISALRPVIPNLGSLLIRAAGGPLLAAIAAAGAASLAVLSVNGTWWRIGFATIAGGAVYLAAALPFARGVVGAANAARFARYFSIYDSVVARLFVMPPRRSK
jgi:PST family polysaccharide transporter